MPEYVLKSTKHQFLTLFISQRTSWVKIVSLLFRFGPLHQFYLTWVSHLWPLCIGYIHSQKCNETAKLNWVITFWILVTFFSKYTIKSRVLTRPVLKHISFLSTPKMPIFWIEARLEYKQHLLCTYIKGKEKYLELHSYFRKKIKKNVGSLSEKRKTFTKNALD